MYKQLLLPPFERLLLLQPFELLELQSFDQLLLPLLQPLEQLLLPPFEWLFLLYPRAFVLSDV